MGIFEIFSCVRMPTADTRVSPRDRPKLSDLESVKCKPDVLITSQLPRMSLFRIGFTRKNYRSVLFLSLCLQHESVLYCLEKWKHLFLNVVDMVKPNFSKFQLIKISL